MRFLWPLRFLPERRCNNRYNFFWVEEKETNLSQICHKCHPTWKSIDISYNQLLLLLQQMPVRAQLRLGKALTNQSIRAELDYFLDVFRTNEISEEDILAEVKAVRHERYALCS